MGIFSRRREQSTAVAIRTDDLVSEFRDPRGGTSVVGWQPVGRPQVQNWDAASAINKGYYASWLVNRAVNIIADSVSALPFRAGADLEDPSSFSQDAALARLLGPPPEGPNPELSARTLWKLAVKNYLVTGRFAWEIADANTEMISLWPLVTGALRPVVSDGGRSYFTGFEYEQSAGPPVKFTREEVVYAWNPSVDDVRMPESVLKGLRLNASILVQLDSYHYGFISNDAKPAAVVVHGGFADKNAERAFIRQFLGNHQGPANANKTAFMEVDPDDDGEVAGMIDIKQLGATNKDSQITAIYEQQTVAVCSGLGVPRSLLDASGRTFDNASQESKNYYELTILPLCAALQDHINRDLAPKLGSEVGWFDISKVEALKPRLTQGMSLGDISADMERNERRALIGLGPADDAAIEEEKSQAMKLAQKMAPPAPAAEGNAPPEPAASNGAKDDTGQGPGRKLAVVRGESRRTKQRPVVPVEDLDDLFDDEDSGPKGKGSLLPALAAIGATLGSSLMSPDQVTVWQASEGSCDDCDILDGTQTKEEPPLHPNCRCELVVVERSERHQGAPGHDHVVTGHSKSPTKQLDQAIEAARESSVARVAALFDRQVERLDARSEKAALARATGKRGVQALERGITLDAVYERAFWIDETRAALAPVYESAAAAASAAVAGSTSVEPDLDAWVDARSEALAQVLVGRRAEALVEGLHPDLDQENLVALIHRIHQHDPLDFAAIIFDDAVRAVTGIPRETVRDLLSKLVSGELDLDRAMTELVT